VKAPCCSCPRDKTPDEGIVLELLEEIIHIEFQLGVKHDGSAFWHVRVGDEFCIFNKVETGQYHHFYGVDFQQDTHVITAHFGIVIF